VLLAFAPALNLIAVGDAAAAPVLHHCLDRHASKSDCSGKGSHLDLRCLQCLVMGGMSLAGADLPTVTLPAEYLIDAGWPDSADSVPPVAALAPICRGPPSFA